MALGARCRFDRHPVGAVVLEPTSCPGWHRDPGHGRSLVSSSPVRAACRMRLGIAIAVHQGHEQVGTARGGLDGRGVRMWRIDLAHGHARIPGSGGDLVRPADEPRRRATHGSDHDDRLVGRLAGASRAGAIGRVRNVRRRGTTPSASSRHGHGHRAGRRPSSIDATATARLPSAAGHVAAQRGRAASIGLSGITGARPEGRTSHGTQARVCEADLSIPAWSRDGWAHGAPRGTALATPEALPLSAVAAGPVRSGADAPRRRTR